MHPTRRDFVKTVGAASAAVLAGKAGDAMSEEKKRTNLVYVFPDQYRKHAMGFLGEDPVLTPRLDAFAKESVFLPHAISNYPVCSPYRAMLMTGQYSPRNGVLANCNSDRTHLGNYLKEDARCLTDVLSEAGYSLGYIGKWHLDGPEPIPGSDRAEWDAFTPPGPKRHSVDFWYSYGTFNDHFHPHYWTGEGGEDSRLEIDQWSPEHEADVATAFIRNDGGTCRRSGEPFALFVSMNPPHSPYHLVPDRYKEMYAGKTRDDLLVRPNVDLTAKEGSNAETAAADYFAMVTGVDEQFGRILDALRDEGLEEDTIVVFTSDHGEMMGSQGRMAKNVIYEESLNVPFLLRWKGQIAAREDDLILSTPDLYPSLLGMMGLSENVPGEVQGADRSDVLMTGEGERPDGALFLRLPAGEPEGGVRGLRTHTHTYQAPAGRDTVGMLFDNAADPFQMENLAGKDTPTENRMREKMMAWVERTDDPWRGRGD